MYAKTHTQGTPEGQRQGQGGEEEMTVNAMTAAEFKAWLEGFMENRGGRLTQKDVKRIQAQAASVLGCGCGCYHPYRPWTWTTTPTIFSGTVSNQDQTDFTTYGISAGSTVRAMGSTGNAELSMTAHQQ